MREVFELETRQKIYNLIKKNPGLHLSKIAEILHLRISLVEYHVRYLEKNKIILASKEIGYKRYYGEGDKIGVDDKKLLALLRRETPLRIVLFLLDCPGAIHEEISERLKIAKSTLTYHLQMLVDLEIVQVERMGKEKAYTIRNEQKIVQVLIQFQPYKVLESFTDIWTGLQVD